MEIRLQAWFCHAGTVGPRRVCLGLTCVVADEGLALAGRPNGPCCQLALHALRNMPTNNQLKSINSTGAGSTSRMLIGKWGRLHAVRSVLGFAATLIFLWASMS